MPPAASPGTLVFSHANSFPAGTYRMLFETWHAAGYTVHAIDKYGHDPRYPVTDRWPRLSDQLADFIAARSAGPVWLVGHSLGGYLSVLTAARQPQLARGVVLLDSPLIGGLLSPTLRLAKATGWGARFLPSHVSRNRRHHWPSAEAAFAHFAAKPAFARWDPSVLKDFIACGIEPARPPLGTGQTLSFRRDVETDIYDTLPEDIPRVLRRHPLQCPAAFIGGTASAEVRRVGLKATRRLTDDRVSWVEGSHLFPLEQPRATCAEVLSWLRTLANRPAAG